MGTNMVAPRKPSAACEDTMGTPAEFPLAGAGPPASGPRVGGAAHKGMSGKDIGPPAAQEGRERQREGEIERGTYASILSNSEIKLYAACVNSYKKQF